MDNSVRIIQVIDEDLERGNIATFKRLFNEISSVPSHAKLLKGNILITFPKYDEDPREYFEIDEIRTFVQRLDAEFAYFMYFLQIDSVICAHISWITCLLQYTRKDTGGKQWTIEIDPLQFAILLADRILSIKKFCEDILDDEMPIINSILQSTPREIAESTIMLLV